MILLDSNVLSELRPGKASPSEIVRAWAATAPLKLFFLSSVTILEQEEGVLREERRTPPGGQALRRWATQVHKLFAGRILVS
jgi:predicted nucleic acid-binding protein